MKSKKEVFDTLETILGFYENYRTTLGLSVEEATKKTLETYSDFYEWLQKDK